MADHGGTSTYRPSLAEVLDGTELTWAEQQVLDDRKIGAGAILGDDVPEKPTDKTRVRAALIRYLLLGGDEDNPPHPKGVDIIGAWIDGALDFEGCETGLDAKLALCHFPETPVFRDARLGGLYLTGSHAKHGVNLHRLETETSVHLRDGFRCSGLANLGGARIGGQLACDGGSFAGEEPPEGKRGPALNCDAATVGAGVFLSDGFAATGEVNLRGAAIGGQLSCSGGRFDGAGGRALHCDAATVGADVFLRGGFAATGEVSLIRAAIGGQLDCSGGRFDGAGGKALTCDAATVGADVFLGDGFAATGEVNLVRAAIGGQLDCSGGRFDGAGGRALTCNAATVGADVFLCPDDKGRDCLVTGTLDFTRARIEGNLQIIAATLNGAVDLESARIVDGLFWQDISGAQSVVNLTETQVGVLRDQAAAWTGAGILRLSGFRYDRLESSMRVAERLKWLGRKQERPVLPAVGEEVDVQGFKLKRPLPWITGAYANDFDPQPYTQLAKVLESQGNRTGAARVRMAREHLVRKASRLRARMHLDGSVAMGLQSVIVDLRRPWDFLYRWVFGYGEQPVRALVWVFLIWFGSLWLYGAVYTAGQMAPNSDVVLTSAHWIASVAAFDACRIDCVLPLRAWEQAPSYQDYETFSAGLYALDLFVPLDALGQESAWAPSKDRGWLGELGYWARMPIQMAGWLITAVAAGVLTGLVGRKD